MHGASSTQMVISSPVVITTDCPSHNAADPKPQVPTGYADLHRCRNHPNGGEVSRYGPPVPGTLSLVVTRVIRDVAEDLYLSQAELGRRSGVPQSTISRAYKGTQAFTIDQLDALCSVLGVSLAAVVDEAQKRLGKNA